MSNFGYVPAIHPAYNPLEKINKSPNSDLVDKVKSYVNSKDNSFKMQMTMVLGLLGRYVSGEGQSSVTLGLANLETVLVNPEYHPMLQGAFAMAGMDYECNRFESPQKVYEEFVKEASGSGWIKNKVTPVKWSYDHVARESESQIKTAAESGVATTVQVTAMDRLLYLFSLKDGSMEERVNLALKASSTDIDAIYKSSMKYIQQNMMKYDDLWDQVLNNSSTLKEGTIAQRLGLQKSEYMSFKKVAMNYDGSSGRPSVNVVVASVADNLSDKMWQSLMTVSGYKAVTVTVLKMLSMIPDLPEEMNLEAEIKAYQSGQKDEEIELIVQSLKFVGGEDIKYAFSQNISLIGGMIPGGLDGPLGNLDYLSLFDSLSQTIVKIDKKANPAQILGGVMQIFQKAVVKN